MSKSTLQNTRVLVVDDHRNIRLSLRLTLEEEGAIVTEAETFKEGADLISHSLEQTEPAFDLMLFDIRLPDGNGLDLLRKLAEKGVASQVIVISGEGTMSEAFQATQIGAFDFVEKPFTSERILVSVGRCLSYNNIQTENRALTKTVLRGQEILGNHTTVVELRESISRVGPTNGRILIRGESGTGKELVAKAVHRESSRKHQSLVKVNCAAIPHSLVESELFGHEKGSFTGALKTRKGLFEQAHGGTLFLDEIGELSQDVQAKLLRVLQNGEISRVGGEKIIKVDVRLLAATHRDLETMVENGEFREDLFYRLNVLSLNVPPLRDRGEDVTLLASHFLEEACQEHSVGYRAFSEEALRQINEYKWPGNIRELKNIVERTAILSETQVVTDIPDISSKKNSAPKGLPAPEEKPVQSLECGEFSVSTDVVPWQEFNTLTGKAYIKYVLTKASGNVSEAARILCLERAYLHRLMKKLGVQRGVVVKD